VAGINKVIIVGNIGKIDIKETQYDTKVVNMSVATSVKFKNGQGEQQEETTWHSIVLFKKLADIAAQYCKKGDKVYIEGSLKTEKWQTKEGENRYTTKIIARELQMLGNKEREDVPANATPQTSADNAAWADDDLPF